MKFAICAPVTKPTDVPVGSPKSSTSQAAATTTTTAAAGEAAYRPAFWSHVVVSQSAASDAGVAPPNTNPKNRPLPLGNNPSSTPSASRAITFRGSVGPAGSGPPSASRSSPAVARGPTRRSGSPSRYAVARS